MEIERATVCAYVVRFILYSNNIVDLTGGMGEGDASFFLTIDIPIEVSGVCLNITNQVIHIQIMLFSYIFATMSTHFVGFVMSRLEFPETLKFWQIGHRLFHGKFLHFMSGL